MRRTASCPFPGRSARSLVTTGANSWASASVKATVACSSRMKSHGSARRRRQPFCGKERDGSAEFGGAYSHVAHPNPRHCLDVARHIEADLETGVCRAKISLAAVAHKPPAPFRSGLTGKVELNGDPARRKGVRLHSASHVPEQEADVEFVAAGAEPPSTGRLGRRPGLRPAPFRSPLRCARPPLRRIDRRCPLTLGPRAG